MLMSEGGRVRLKPPPRPRWECSSPARTSCCRTLDRYPAGTWVVAAMSCKGLDEAGFSARNTTARRAYSEVLEIMNSPYSDNWVLTSNLMDLPLKVPGKVPLTLTKVLPSKAPAVWLEPRSPFHRW